MNSRSLQVGLLVCAMLAGCGGDRDCPRWHDGGEFDLEETTLGQWARMPVERQLAATALAAGATFEFADEHAWIAAAASIQECANDVARAGDGDMDALAVVVVSICALGVEPRRGMRRRPEFELGSKPDP